MDQQYFTDSYEKHTKYYKREKVIKHSIKIATVTFFLFSVLSGCSEDKHQLESATPFQCISSQSTCEVTTKFGTVLVKFNVEKVLAELPFSLLIELTESKLSTNIINNPNDLKVLGYMEGKTMFMGKIPLFFNKNKEGGESNQFIAETMLGSCSEDIMRWRLWLTLEINDTNNKKQQTTFFIDFDSTRF